MNILYGRKQLARDCRSCLSFGSAEQRDRRLRIGTPAEQRSVPTRGGGRLLRHPPEAPAHRPECMRSCDAIGIRMNALHVARGESCGSSCDCRPRSSRARSHTPDNARAGVPSGEPGQDRCRLVLFPGQDREIATAVFSASTTTGAERGRESQSGQNADSDRFHGNSPFRCRKAAIVFRIFDRR
jgi:hypothetical protein